MQLVVPSAVRNAVSAATTTFTANSITFCFFILGFKFLPRIHTEFHGIRFFINDNSDNFDNSLS